MKAKCSVDHKRIKTNYANWIAQTSHCGIQYSEDGAPDLELRNCLVCGTTLSRPIPGTEITNGNNS